MNRVTPAAGKPRCEARAIDNVRCELRAGHRGMHKNGPRGFTDSRPTGEVWVTVDCDGTPCEVDMIEDAARENASGVPGARVFRYVPERKP